MQQQQQCLVPGRVVWSCSDLCINVKLLLLKANVACPAVCNAELLFEYEAVEYCGAVPGALSCYCLELTCLVK